VAIFTAVGGPLFAAYAIMHSSTMEGVVVGVPLMAAGGFAVGALAAGTGNRAVVRAWTAVALVVFAIVASVVFAALGM
jgi:hypothetical protein